MSTRIRTQTRWIDATSASVVATPDGIALNFYEKRKNRDAARPSAVVFLSRPQWANLKRQSLK